jgi:hypothetical protein
MREIYPLFIFLILFNIIGCEMNTSVYVYLENPKVQSENGIDISVFWQHAVPLYYFNYNHAGQIYFIIELETDEPIADVVLSSYSIVVPELGIDYQEKGLSVDISLKAPPLQGDIENKRFYRRNYVQMKKSFLADTIQNEEQLSAFKEVKYIFLHTTLEYTIRSEKKISTFIWKFRPQVKRSSAFLDKWMSV